MRISLYAYQSDPSLSQKDGVNISHTEIARLMRSTKDSRIRIHFHDFLRVCNDEKYAYEVLSQVDCVISNVGPHAHYYFYLREKFGLNFKIIRDIRTALWSSYLLQEFLCHPYLRPEDVLIVSSRYSRELSKHIFPHLKQYKIDVFNSVLIGLSPFKSTPKKQTKLTGRVKLGYLGRLSEDKNFPQLIDLLIRLDQSCPGKFCLLACGDIHSHSCHPEKQQQKIHKKTGKSNIFKYFPPVNHAQVWDLYDQFDVFLFPSTSNLETLGRVLIEASCFGLPILASDHAAAPELFTQAALSSVDYAFNKRYSAHFDYPLGSVDIGDMVFKLEQNELDACRCSDLIQYNPNRLVEILLDEVNEADSNKGIMELTSSQLNFIKSVQLFGIPKFLDIQESNELISNLLDWFCALQNKGTPQYTARLQQLMSMSKYKARTERYILKSARSKADFTNVGGVDIELCHVANFYPEFSLTQS